MSRYSPYITKPPINWQKQIDELKSIRLFLVSTLGPTVFILKGDDMTESTFKIFIGERQMCSCGGGEGRGQLCIHLIFVMIKVLRVPTDNPIAWQLSLVDSEIDSVLSGEIRSYATKRATGANEKNVMNGKTYKYLKKGEGMMMRRRNNNLNGHTENTCIDVGGIGTVEEENNGLRRTIARKQFDEDNICSICQDLFTPFDFENDILCFCEIQCGTNFHKKCFRMYAAYNRSEKKPILCPMCRSAWSKVPDLPPNEANPRKHPYFSKKMKCIECQSQIIDEVFRCASCNLSPSYDLCSQCFKNNIICRAQHLNCVFVKADIRKTLHNAVEWEGAQKHSLTINTFEANTYEHLLYRNLDSSDYDLLLSLGSINEPPPLHHHLLQALTEADSKVVEDKTCCICFAPKTNSKPMRFLPCRSNSNHIAHESCIIDLLIEAQASNIFGNAGAQCPTCNDKSWLFPMLVDDPIATKTKMKKKSKMQTKNRPEENQINPEKEQVSTCSESLRDLCILGTSSQMNNYRHEKRTKKRSKLVRPM